MTPTELEIVTQEALSWLDTPYVPKARIKGVGVDCGHILYAVYSKIRPGLPLPPDDYVPDWALHNSLERYINFILPYVREVHRVQPGGFTMCHIAQAYSHAAIMLPDGDYIHAMGRKGQGRVMKSKVIQMNALARKYGFPLRHFEPI